MDVKLLAIGDNVVDYYEDQDMFYPGGNALNVAVLSKRAGAEASYIGIVGGDEAGDHVLKVLKQEGIDISRIRRAYGQNGMAVVKLNEQGERVFVRSNKGGIQSELGLILTEEDADFIACHDIVHTSVYSRMEHALIELGKHAAVSFDFSTNYEREYVKRVCPYLTYAFFSGSGLTKEECLQLIGDASRFGAEMVCVTRGEESALFCREGSIIEQPVFPVRAIDTLGAGDSFIAGFLTAYMKERDLKKALMSAAETAADTCLIYGAFGCGHPFSLKDRAN
ncbi:fructoselysine 6-kinase [Bacillus sonorensis]|uniref:Fructoselysine kinase n=1 Tax=Bacillus sonorensis L12 TaxID=1274524 RepID=M5P0X3_9BACI|nr:fructoselysine kinase [Bacillus sonorensis L12]PAD58400.1 fructoselysine 6-kinase [Bacillus sonorensis]